MTSVVASVVRTQNKMPLSRAHPFTVTSHAGYMQDGPQSPTTADTLPPLKAVTVATQPPGPPNAQCQRNKLPTGTANVARHNTSAAGPVSTTVQQNIGNGGSAPGSLGHMVMITQVSGQNVIGNDRNVCTITKTDPSDSVNNMNASRLQQPAPDKPKALVATPDQVMKLYMNKLTPYEHLEIYNYPQVYFIGVNAKKRPGRVGHPNNSEYDNEQGSYIHIPHDHVAYRYEVLKVIGKGSFGQVVKAYDHKTHQHVALKMVRNEKRFHRQAQEEIRILEHLRKQDKDNTMNIIHMYDSFTFRNHMCITFELLSINLHELTKKNKFQGFSLQLVRKFSHSLLQCLEALHKNKIIHCDMKPENVLLKQQGRSGLKVSYLIILFCHAMHCLIPHSLLSHPIHCHLASHKRTLSDHQPIQPPIILITLSTYYL